jgi:hypothetical protein
VEYSGILKEKRRGDGFCLSSAETSSLYGDLDKSVIIPPPSPPLMVNVEKVLSPFPSVKPVLKIKTTHLLVSSMVGDHKRSYINILPASSLTLGEGWQPVGYRYDCSLTFRFET